MTHQLECRVGAEHLLQHELMIARLERPGGVALFGPPPVLLLHGGAAEGRLHSKGFNVVDGTKVAAHVGIGGVVQDVEPAAGYGVTQGASACMLVAHYLVSWT